MLSGAANVSEAPETPDKIETIFVVDDEVLIRMSIAEYLRDCGYRVVEAANGDEAIAVLTATDCKTDLILSDVQMPGTVDGFALARRVRQHLPDIEIILTSGYAGAAQQSKELCIEKNFVPKPFEFERLLHHIKQSLARRARRT